MTIAPVAPLAGLALEMPPGVAAPGFGALLDAAVAAPVEAAPAVPLDIDAGDVEATGSTPLAEIPTTPTATPQVMLRELPPIPPLATDTTASAATKGTEEPEAEPRKTRRLALAEAVIAMPLSAAITPPLLVADRGQICPPLAELDRQLDTPRLPVVVASRTAEDTPVRAAAPMPDLHRAGGASIPMAGSSPVATPIPEAAPSPMAAPTTSPITPVQLTVEAMPFAPMAVIMTGVPPGTLGAGSPITSPAETPSATPLVAPPLPPPAPVKSESAPPPLPVIAPPPAPRRAGERADVPAPVRTAVPDPGTPPVPGFALPSPALTATDAPVAPRRPPAVTPATTRADTDTISAMAGFRLDSAALGRLDVAVEIGGALGTAAPERPAAERLHVHFAVERAATAALIAEGGERLERALLAGGARLDAVSVSAQPHGEDAPAGSTPRDSNSDASRRDQQSGSRRPAVLAPPPAVPIPATRDRFA